MAHSTPLPDEMKKPQRSISGTGRLGINIYVLGNVTRLIRLADILPIIASDNENYRPADNYE